MQNLDPYSVAPKDMQELIALHAFLDAGGLEEPLVELVRLHVSQLNGCIPGVRRHGRRARALGETVHRIAAIGAWRTTPLFSERERCALRWAAAIASMTRSRITDADRASVRRWFTDIEVVKLTLIVAATLAWNLVEMSLFNPPTAMEER